MLQIQTLMHVEVHIGLKTMNKNAKETFNRRTNTFGSRLLRRHNMKRSYPHPGDVLEDPAAVSSSVLFSLFLRKWWRSSPKELGAWSSACPIIYCISGSVPSRSSLRLSLSRDAMKTDSSTLFPLYETHAPITYKFHMTFQLMNQMAKHINNTTFVLMPISNHTLK